MTDIAGDIGGIVGGGLAMATGAVVIGGVGNMMLDAANEMSNKKKRKRKGKSKSSISIPKINI